ncbi:MAG: poly(A) polymerase [Desulfurivibrionaceae bacterium]
MKKETENKINGADSFSYPDPALIPKSRHGISPDQIDSNARKVLTQLNEAGFAAYLVGGGVRDLYLGRTPKDFDISTEARPGQLRKLFRNSRTIGRRFRLVQVFFPGNEILEVSTFRCRSEYDLDKKDQVLAANNTYGSMADDAFRRDLTINSLFYDLTTEEIIDYTGGVDDLKKGIVRLIGEPERRIIRDPARMLRVIRHAARSNFTVEEETWQAIIKHREEINLCPTSRVRDELFRDLSGTAGSKWLDLAVRSGLFFEIYPCYLYLLENKEAGTKSLRDIMAVIDRLRQKGCVLPEYILLGLTLIPWAQHHFPVLAEKQKGLGAAYSLSRDIRDRLEQEMAHLNLKRAVRAQIAGLISRLPLFAAHDTGRNWPAHLKKKSYFSESSQFYLIYREALGGPEVQSVNFSEIRPRKARPAQKPEGRPAGGQPNGKRRRKTAGGPAFAPKDQEGGVFGLKKSEVRSQKSESKKK